ncbi:hypothetical protein [Parafrankia sp. EUN1f]|uniref:hypothetical protein n=1 Tax=Parafrankia sp. EUN1f TaxID=102897 RepID=UPI0001C45FB2|nr:hypothetical protein [Parafrankia sp. EUN1f]EFC81425.1 hypothetical protein FrEUN1fDRAFT_5477 [Parafrankia sp. EUN1f]
MIAGADGVARPEGTEPRQSPRWWTFQGTGEPARGFLRWPVAPPGRRFPGHAVDGGLPPLDADERGRHQAGLTAALLGPEEISAVNVGLALRRPLLVTGSSETGRAGLAHLIARELRLGRVLRWAVNGRTILRDGIIEEGAAEIGPPDSAAAPGDRGVDPALMHGAVRRPLRLAPLATALLPRSKPRVLLVDGLDRADHELPDDLAEIIERGEVVVPELRGWLSEADPVTVATDDPGVGVTLDSAVIQCAEFPVIVLVSDGDREFSPRLRRRCVSVRLPEPSLDELLVLVRARFGDGPAVAEVAKRFGALRDAGAGLTVDELLDAAHLAAAGALDDAAEADRVLDAIWNALSEGTSRWFAGRPS